MRLKQRRKITQSTGKEGEREGGRGCLACLLRSNKLNKKKRGIEKKRTQKNSKHGDEAKERC